VRDGEVTVTMRTIRPERLHPGDHVLVVSPSSTIAGDRETAETARANLERVLGLEIEFAKHALGQHYYSSGTASERHDDVMAAFADPEVKAIFLSMGGATAIDLVDRLDYETIAANPKVLAGISDSSTLLDAVTRRTGLVTFHGFEMLDFARHEMPYTAEWMMKVWFDAWSGCYAPNPGWRDLAGEPTRYRGWREIRPGKARGLAVGGNTEAFMQLVDTKYCPPLDGAILFVETYRLQKRHIHALFAHLRLRGVFDRIHGLVVGYCVGSDAPGVGNERAIADVVEEVLASYEFPVMQIGEIGHQVENLILPIGAAVEIDTARLSFELIEPAVS
jgi:muramoyltetrapeptide carboxypeptidase